MTKMQLIKQYLILGEMDTTAEQLNNTDSRIIDALCNSLNSSITEDNDRIKDGLCVTQETKKETERITAKSRKHYGDSGVSLLMNGTRISKSHPACKFYGSVEELQQAIAECLYYVNLYDDKTTETFKWLFRNLFSLSSFTFCKGDSTRHQFPQRFLEFIEEDCSLLQEEIGGAKDFIAFSHKDLLRLNKIRVAIRKVECYFVSWKDSREMTSFLLDNPHLIQGVNFHTTVLNRLSSWLFWVSRKHGLYLQSQGLPLEESYWSAEIEPFNF